MNEILVFFKFSRQHAGLEIDNMDGGVASAHQQRSCSGVFSVKLEAVGLKEIIN